MKFSKETKLRSIQGKEIEEDARTPFGRDLDTIDYCIGEKMKTEGFGGKIHSFNHSFNQSISCFHYFIHSFNHSFIHLFIHLLIHLFIY